MKLPIARTAAAAAIAFVTARAVGAADADVFVANNTTIVAAFAAGGETHAYGAVIPAGAKFTVALRTAKKGPSLHATLTGPTGTSLGDKSGKAPSFKNVTAATSGSYALTVASADGASIGGYSAAVAWKSPKGPVKTIVLDPDGAASIAFSADAGATATISLKKVKRSTAVPVLVGLDRPDGVAVALAGPSAVVALNDTGSFVVRFGAGPAGGGVKAVVVVKPPKSPKLSVALAALAAGAEATATKRIGPPGGALAIVAGPLDGASVSVPAGAVAAPTSILLGNAFSVAGVQSGAAAGPTIFAGPEGLTFPPGKPAVVTIPFDPSAFGGDVSKLRVYTRDATGAVTLVPNPVVDLVNHVVSFPASHFSAFQVLSAFTYAEPQELQNPSGTTKVLFGDTLALSGDVAAIAQRRSFSDNTYEVEIYHRAGGSFALESELLSPGGQNDGFANASASVAASGDRVLVGARGRFTSFGINSGAGLVFVRDSTAGWSYEAELALPTSQQNDFAGASVALDGDTAAVGAPSAQSGPTARSGAVHVFVRDASSGVWSLQQTVTLPTETDACYLGTLRGDTLIAFGSAAGVQTVHVFHRAAGVWTRDGAIPAPDPDGSGGGVGQAAVDGTTIVLGVVPGSLRGGEARVYEDQGTTFPEIARLSSADATGPGEAPGSAYARSIALRGDLLLVGTPSFSPRFPGAPTNLNGAGQTFVYRRVGGAWRLAARLRGTASDAFPVAAGDGFGVHVALDGTTAIVGASGTRTADGFVGATFVFDFSGN